MSNHAEKLEQAMEEKRYTTGEHALTAEEARAVLAEAEALEHKALLAVGLSTGIRRADVVTLERDRMEWFEGSEPGQHAARVRFWESKKERPWTAWIVPDLAEPLRLHLKNLSPGRWVFPSRQGGHISPRTAYNWWKKALVNAGLEPRPFHALRATCMQLARERDWTIEETMWQTGDSWRTVQEHYMTPSDADMRDRALGTNFLPEKGDA